MGRRFGILMVFVAGLLALALGGVAQAAVVVTNGNDEGPGSLREAIDFAEDGGTVVVPASVGEIHLDSEIAISRSVTIEGTGATRPVISADGKSRIFKIGNPVDVEISGVTIANGKAPLQVSVAYGGAILVEEGDVTLTNVFMDRNEADASAGGGGNGLARGGAIETNGSTSLTLRNSILTDNSATGGSKGGAEAFGGAIYSGGELTIEGGQVKGNYAEAFKVKGGGINVDSEKPTLLKGVALTGNEAKPYPGSSANAEGGGINLEGPATLSGVLVARNKASGDLPTTEFANDAGGGLSSRAAATIVNSTFTGNLVSAQVKSNGSAVGGAIATTNEPMTIINSTLAGNTVQASGTSSVSRAGNLFASGPVTVTDTILSAGETSNGPQNCVAAVAKAIASGGHDIDSGQTCGLIGTGDLSNTDPKLAPLADNGGSVETMALQPGSPAIDGGGTDCPATDARGVLRPGGAACDIGAFEVATPVALTEPARDIGLDQATLVGTATDPDLKGGTVSFQYGTATGYGSQTPAQPIGPTTRAGFTAAIAGLSQNTTYHFRIVVTNALGTAVGADQTFTTSSPTRVVIKVAPPAAAKSSITLKRLGGLRFRVHCSGGPCNGSLIARARSGKRQVVVAKAKLRLAAGATRKVSLARTKKGKRLIALPGRLPVIVRAKLGGGGNAPGPVHLKLR